MSEANDPLLYDKSERHQLFDAFSLDTLGTAEQVQKMYQTPAHEKAHLDLFKELYPPKPVEKAFPEFDDPIWSEPWAVYMIYNRENGRRYIGRAASGFLSRYPDGRWWEDHHNESLARDVILCGVAAFTVNLFFGEGEADMEDLEGRLIRQFGGLAYNTKLEPEAKSQPKSRKPAQKRRK